MHPPGAVIVVIRVLPDDFFDPDQKMFVASAFIRGFQAAIVSGLAYS